MGRQPNDLRYRISVHEGRDVMLVAACDSRHLAMHAAKSHVDDALPSNTVRVVDTLKNEEIGYAYFGGDGDAYWSETKPTTGGTK